MSVCTRHRKRVSATHKPHRHRSLVSLCHVWCAGGTDKNRLPRKCTPQKNPVFCWARFWRPLSHPPPQAVTHARRRGFSAHLQSCTVCCVCVCVCVLFQILSIPGVSIWEGKQEEVWYRIVHRICEKMRNVPLVHEHEWFSVCGRGMIPHFTPSSLLPPDLSRHQPPVAYARQ